MFKINPVVQNMAPSGIREFFDLVLNMEGVISLGVGEPDFVTPWNICEYSIYSLEKGYTSYTSNKGILELRKEISKYLEKRYGISYNPESQILITSGVSQGFDLVLRSIIEPGDKVIIPTPSYVSYKPLVQLSGGESILYPVKMEKGFKLPAMDLDKICKKEKNIKAIILNYPCNPTGSTYSRKELLQLSKIIKKYDLIVISDEIYDRISYNFEHTAFPSLPDMFDRTVYLNGFSKAYAMTGWRIGYICGPKEFVSAATKIHQYTMLCAPIMSQMAAIEALKNSELSVSSMLKEYSRRKRFLVKRFNEMGLICHDPQGTFYVYPSIEKIYDNSVSFAKELVKKKKVAVVPGVAFGPDGEKFIRVSFATSLKKIREATQRIESFLS